MSSPQLIHRAALLTIVGLAVGLSSPHTTATADEDRELRRGPVVRAVERARAAVVSIHTTQLIPQYFFDFELPPVEGKGVGSGVIFHPEGYVITNAHVIARAKEVLVDVTTAAGKKETREGHVFAVDIANDLAILRLLPTDGDATPRRDFPHLPIRAVSDLMLGETAIALGNPFGIGLTVTTGVIGGLERRLQLGRGEYIFDDFIQIDAAINPGNSGGALLDLAGRWIGVNTAIWNRLRGAEGIGFAIPIDRVQALVARAFKRRLIRGDWLGMELDAGPDQEAVVRYVYPKGPAHGRGIQKGDVLQSLNGASTDSLLALRMKLAALPAGAAVRLGVRRAGRPGGQVVSIPLIPLPTDGLSNGHLGLLAADIGVEDNREHRLGFDAGVVVRELRPEGPAERIHIRPGDVIVELGDRQIRHTDDLLVFLQYVSPGDVVKVRALRPYRIRGGGVIHRSQEGVLITE